MARNRQNTIRPEVVIAIIGAITAIVTAYFSYSAGVRQTEAPIWATQTAETRQLPIIQTVLVTQPPNLIDTFTLPTVTPTPIPFIIDAMDILDWNLGFCDEKCGGPGRASSIKDVLVPGKRDNAVEILYYLNSGGWVTIKKDINPKILEGTRGISFFYKGIGAPSTIELKLVLNDETTYGAKWNSQTDTEDHWTPIEALYDVNFSCWWLPAQCQQHGSFPVLTAVKRIEISITNQFEDTEGLGKVAFDDLAGIP